MNSNVDRINKIVTSTDEYFENFLGAIVPPTFETTLFRIPDYETYEQFHKGELFRYTYSKNQNPTVDVLNHKLAAMELGEAAKTFASGTAAMYTALMHFLSAGDHMITVRYVYGRIRNFLNDTFQRVGIDSTYVDGTDIGAFKAAIRPNTKVIYLESPSTWQFDLQDLRAVAALARERGIVTIIDNTWATPVFQNPIELGIDVVVHSASKYLGGHSDLVGGVMVASREVIDDLPQFGGVMSPYEAAKLLKSLRTLPLRMERHQSSAMQVAKLLEDSGKFEEVVYPGLVSHPQHELAKSQMHGFSGLMSFIPATDDKGVRRFINSLRHISIAGSWGGFESIIWPIGSTNSPEKLLKSGYKPRQIRLSVGLESIDLILSEIEGAIRSI